MEHIVDYFQTIPSYQRTLMLAGGIVVLWMLEGIQPMFDFRRGRNRHGLLNIGLTVLQLIVGLAFASGILFASDLSARYNIGLLHNIQLPDWLAVVVALLILDLIGAYVVHVVEHKVKWMWKIHLIHHTDTHVDVTTGLRHHPLETVLRSLFGALAVFVAGASIGVFILYQTLSVLFAQVEHANIRIPDTLDRIISWIFVTPNMHKVHHHYVQPLTDTNYGNMFSIWDRLFGTYAYADPDTLTYGIDTHMEEEEHSRFTNLLKLPFQPYRPPVGSKFGSDTAAERPSSD